MFEFISRLPKPGIPIGYIGYYQINKTVYIINIDYTKNVMLLCIQTGYIYIYIYCYYCYFIWWSPFIPSNNLDNVFTYNHIYMTVYGSGVLSKPLSY